VPKYCVTQRVILIVSVEASSEREAEERATQRIESLVREVLNTSEGREGILSVALGETETTDCVELKN